MSAVVTIDDTGTTVDDTGITIDSGVQGSGSGAPLNANLLAVISAAGSLLTGQPIVITAPLSPQTAYVGSPTSWTAAASGGPQPFSWSILALSGNVNSYNINAVTGVITYPTGSAVNAGIDYVQVTATNASGTESATLNLEIIVKPAIGPLAYAGPLVFETPVDTAFRVQLQGTGGLAPLAWTLDNIVGNNPYVLSTNGILSSNAVSILDTDDLYITITDMLGNTVQVVLQVNITVAISPNAAPYLNLITSEHNQKPKFMAMVGAITGSIGDVTQVLNSIPGLYDLDDAVGVQLDTVGLWVGQPRIISVLLTLGYFGFADDPAALTMGELHNSSFNTAYAGLFFELGGTFETGTTVLGDDDYRTLLRARIVRNQSNGLIGSIEQGLEYIFGAPCAIQDTGNLILNITVPVNVSAFMEAIVKQLDILPRPAGVRIGTVSFPTS